MEATEIEIGMRVQGGKPGTEDHDTGRVLAIDGELVTVGWDSGVRTQAAARTLRPAD